MTNPDTPPNFNCKQRRHKVITGDGICVICGARGVTDARIAPALRGLDVSPTWTVHPVRPGRSFNSRTGWAAVAPGCPAASHSHRDCECRIFPDRAEAAAYASERDVS